MAEIESRLSKHLLEVTEARSFPSSEHFESIMHLMAQLSVRNPRFRGVNEKFHAEVAERIMGMTLSSEKIWRSQIRQLREAGYAVNDSLTYEEMRSFHERKQYKIIVDQTHLIGLELRSVEPVVERLAQRNWCFVSAPEGMQYITSDEPVALTWKDRRQAGHLSPGHGLSGTLICFSLNSNLMLIGAFEDLPAQLIHLPDQVVATNTHLARYSTSQIFAMNGSFQLIVDGRGIVRGDELSNLSGCRSPGR